MNRHPSPAASARHEQSVLEAVLAQIEDLDEMAQIRVLAAAAIAVAPRCSATIIDPHIGATVHCERQAGHDADPPSHIDDLSHEATFDSGRVRWSWRTGQDRPWIQLLREGS